MPEFQPVTDPPRRRRTDDAVDADARRAYRQIAEISYALFRQRGSDPAQTPLCWEDAAQLVLDATQPGLPTSHSTAPAER